MFVTGPLSAGGFFVCGPNLEWCFLEFLVVSVWITYVLLEGFNFFRTTPGTSFITVDHAHCFLPKQANGEMPGCMGAPAGR